MIIVLSLAKLHVAEKPLIPPLRINCGCHKQSYDEEKPKMRYLLLILPLMLFAAPTVHASKITTTEDLIAAMQKKYGKSWYKTATFVQRPPSMKRMERLKHPPGTKRCPSPAACGSTSPRSGMVTASCSRMARSIRSRMARWIAPDLSSIR